MEKCGTPASITWGKVIAGAAVAVGAVVLLSTVMPDKALEGIGTWIADSAKAIGAAITGLFASNPDAAAKPFDWTLGITSKQATVAGGAALVGAGLMLNSSMNAKLENAIPCLCKEDESAGKFEMREKLAALNALQASRINALNPGYMGQGQQR